MTVTLKFTFNDSYHTLGHRVLSNNLSLKQTVFQLARAPHCGQHFIKQRQVKVYRSSFLSDYQDYNILKGYQEFLLIYCQSSVVCREYSIDFSKRNLTSKSYTSNILSEDLIFMLDLSSILHSCNNNQCVLPFFTLSLSVSLSR